MSLKSNEAKRKKNLQDKSNGNPWKNNMNNESGETTKEGNSKFRNACQQIEESVKKYIATHKIDDDEIEAEEEEGQVKDSSVIERILRGYDGDRDLEKVQHRLQEGVGSGSLICLICIEIIKRNNLIWSCEECFSSFHLDCIQKWSKDSIYLQSQSDSQELSSASGRRNVEKHNYKWFCPKCRHDYPSSKIPSEYKCFCGKLKNPQFDPWLIPHSCGEKCNKKLKPNCGHSCLILCHPGPCPPCPVMVRYPCYCPKALTEMKRCSSKFWSCNSKCFRLLACGQHKCQDLCHEGSCATCSRTSVQKCQCGNLSQMKPCSDIEWQCDKVCDEKFDCGHHSCERVCHKGPCGDCPYGGRRSCPCGKQFYDLECTESVPTCGDTCSKTLSCVIHFCSQRCHKGACSTCMQFRVKKCNCGAWEKELPCSKNFTCEVKCRIVRDCRKHTCNRRCCTGNCPSCDQSCGKTLGCGQHKCQSRCHQLRCYPCTITHQISCTCGRTTITVPCGRERRTPLPKCSEICFKKTLCHHPKSKPHNCHVGKCPPCKFICNIKLPCKHNCAAPCHDSVPIKIVDQRKPVGPWDKVAPKIEIKKLPCPPCMFMVPNTCLGRHNTVDWPCSELRPYSCGRTCGRQLDCSHHSCEKECHIVEDAKDDHSQGVGCQPCERPCSQPRPEGCQHPCKLACHPGSCPPCKQNMRFKCHCGILQIYVECTKWVRLNAQEQDKLRSCTNQCNKQISCGHLCGKECHSGQCSSTEECRAKVTVRCPCKRRKKEFACFLVASNQAELLCDEICAKEAKEKAKLEERRKRQEQMEDEERKKKDLREYNKFILGRKKRRKYKTSNNGQDNDDASWRFAKQIIFIICIIVIGILFYYITK